MTQGVGPMSAVAIIPARLRSTRFPEKVLADRSGKPLVQHVYERTRGAARIRDVFIACDDQRIADVAAAFGATAVLTRVDHENGTSRIAEAVRLLGLKDQIVVNVQGDEPEIDPALVDLAVDMLESSPDCAVSTVASPFAMDERASDPNVVKVVIDAVGRAMYFSRLPIPFPRDGSGPAQPLKHIGLYAYRASFLEEYESLTPTPLEQTERLEQLRILEHGRRIAVAVGESHTHGIDTPEQYEAWLMRLGITKTT